MSNFNDWADEIKRIRDHREDGHGLHSVAQIIGSQLMPGVHLSINDPGLENTPICNSFDFYTTAESTEPADCVVCLALAREAAGIDASEQPAPVLPSRNVWKLKAFNHRDREWKTKLVGGEEALSRMLADMLRWKAEGQEVRLEWSELN